MIIDASALLAIALAEDDAVRMLDAISRVRVRRMPAPAWLEAAMVIDRRGNRQAIDLFAALVQKLAIEIGAFSAEHALVARQAWNRFGKTRHKARLNFGDCMVYAVAKVDGQALLCKGNDFIHTDIELVLKD